MENNKETISNNEKVQESSIKKNVTRNSIENNFEIDHIEGTEAYYSERYGWTLRKLKN